jgi:hypothetical protein
MIGHDAQEGSLDDWKRFAREWRRRQLSLLQSELERVEMQHWLRQDEGLPRGAPRRAGGPMALVGAGCGSFLVRALAQATQRLHLSFDSVVAAPPHLQDGTSVCAPAVAVAMLYDRDRVGRS